jgi:hypothetical protein
VAHATVSVRPYDRFAQQQQQLQSATPARQQQPGPAPAADSQREELRTLLKEQQAYERQAMAAEEQQRTGQLVERMWQGLE